MVDLDNGLEFHGVHPPASGAILAYILNIVKVKEITSNLDTIMSCLPMIF